MNSNDFLKMFMLCNSFQAKLLTCKSFSPPSASFFDAGHPKKKEVKVN